MKSFEITLNNARFRGTYHPERRLVEAEKYEPESAQWVPVRNLPRLMQIADMMAAKEEGGPVYRFATCKRIGLGLEVYPWDYGKGDAPSPRGEPVTIPDVFNVMRGYYGFINYGATLARVCEICGLPTSAGRSLVYSLDFGHWSLMRAL